ncbi:MAG: hypothetical protein Q8L92_11970, partial [Rubrivivax sp.]|nr:hypothetical protein [Rubrivivax sp.]
MTPDTSLQPTWRSLALRSFAGARPLQHLGIGAASLLLALLGSIALPASPWSILTLPCGLALAAMWRWGPSSLGAAAAGVLLALLSLMTPPLQALAATAAMSAGLL